MCKFVNAGSTAALLLCLASCATAEPQPVVIVGKEEISVAGQRVHTVEEMRDVLSEKKIASVTLRTEPDVPYEHVGKVIYSIFRMGAKVDKLDLPTAQ